MITEFFVGVGVGIAVWFNSLFPPLDLPAWFVNADAEVNGIFAYGNGLGAWVEWGVVVPILLAPLGFWVLGLTIRGIRVLASHLPFVGGRG